MPMVSPLSPSAPVHDAIEADDSGYRGEYQRKYTRELGYDRIAKQAGGLSGYIDGVLRE